MSTPRLFLDAPLEAGREIPLPPAQAHYLGSVMRRGAGDQVLAFNGADGEWLARIVALRKDRGSLVPDRRTRPQASCPDLRLLVAVLKREAMEWVVEKATELGVARIQPVLTRRSVVDRVNLARLTAIAREAAEQCERLDLPMLDEARPLHGVLDGWDGTPLLVAAERAGAPPLAAVLEGLQLPAAWLVGPEGGFDRAELDDLRRRAFVSPVGLGPRILRAETAAVAGLALLQARAGDWNQS
ncbi:16S rRNA (uracil(1498)-N(3))-methyltransferase [Siccirubricoccus sp. KC 17139]|uniref:Ribosomal RNA small subunit methyltransferase E n=1 Tax=Siccirubricoccus soli TaxID=2899147 RepID=A0ABT1D6L3_9PROT|nr:16S rRNA (uracil(1498)-N(3))-methyltransferase [Siccirubricoccus soli]MCO6417573.1 16S rRNA (uracil(1498)-N(3))-methyltransferase [Siccirubricoccus soli]MCP2683708.1 16S rRNA (uracil(1498)-N(3))-methyltransferase [Siccirubricoccus soli]